MSPNPNRQIGDPNRQTGEIPQVVSQYWPYFIGGSIGLGLLLMQRGGGSGASSSASFLQGSSGSSRSRKSQGKGQSQQRTLTVGEIMTKHPACCTPESRVQDVAQMMIDCDCGAIPVVRDHSSMEPVGVVTDRDIVCRLVADGRNPIDARVEECMSQPVVVVHPESSVHECCDVMEEHQVRRVIVVDENHRCCGMVSQADVARHAPDHLTADVVETLSKPK